MFSDLFVYMCEHAAFTHLFVAESILISLLIKKKKKMIWSNVSLVNKYVAIRIE